MALLPEPIPFYDSVMLDMRALNNADEARSFFSMAIEPTCLAMAAKLAKLPQRGSHETMNRWESLRTVQMETQQSFALGLGAMWERNFRENLRNAAYILAKPVSATLMSHVNGNGWEGIEKAFKRIRGFGFDWFPMYDDLRLLNKLSSAIRHGDGAASKELYATAPSLFLDDVVETGYYSYFAYGGYEPWAVRKLDVPFERLKHFTGVVASFWETIQELRVASAT